MKKRRTIVVQQQTKRGEKDSRLAESIDDYLFLDSYTVMHEMDEKDSAV